MIHLERHNAGLASLDILFHNWESITFDDLNNEFILPREFVEESNFKKLRTSELIPLKKTIENLLPKCLSRIKYNIVDSANGEMINERKNQILREIHGERCRLTELIEQKIAFLIDQDQNQKSLELQGWERPVVLEKRIRDEAASPLEAINLILSRHYEDFIMNIIYRLERDCLMDSYFDAVRGGNEWLISLWCESFQKVEVDVNEKLEDRVVEVNFIFGLLFPFSTYEARIIEKIQDEVDEAEKRENRARLEAINLSRLKESSFYGANVYSVIFEGSDIYNRFIHDQVYLYMIRSNLDMDTNVAVQVLEYMHRGNPQEILGYFLTNAREFGLTLGVVKELLVLKQGRDILNKALRGFYDINEAISSEFSTHKELLPRYMLIYKDRRYYQIHKDQIYSDLQINEDQALENDSPFLYVLFANIVHEISSCHYLTQFEKIHEVKAAFMIIEDKIIKTDFYPSNTEIFRPWVYLLQFIEACDKRPDTLFHDILSKFSDEQTENIFLNAETVRKLIEYLETRTNFNEDFDETQKRRKLIKFRTQIYKNFASSYTDESFVEVICILDKDLELWRSSAKILDLLDAYTGFSSAILQLRGMIEGFEDFPQLKMLEEKILRQSSEKIHLLVANKAFLIIEAKYHKAYKKFLTDYHQTFQGNLIYFQNLSKAIKDNKKDDVHLVSLLGVIVWLKVYMNFYSVALENDDKDIDVLGSINNLIGEPSVDSTERTPEIASLQLYVLKSLKFRKIKSFGRLKAHYRDRTVHWINSVLSVRPRAGAVNIIPLIPLNNETYLFTMDRLLRNVFSGEKAEIETFVKVCGQAKGEYGQLIFIYSLFIRFYMRYSESQSVVYKPFIELIGLHKESLLTHLGDIGYRFIILLLSNFKWKSFLHLSEKMNSSEVQQKIVLVSIIASMIAQRSVHSIFSSFLFENNQLPKNLSVHLSNQCLFGQPENSTLPANMRSVKAGIEKRLQQNLIAPDAKFIYKCSDKCDYMFYFEACGRPAEKLICKECGSEIGATSYNELLKRNNGSEQIAMPITDSLKYIDEYLKEYQGYNVKGYKVDRLTNNKKFDTKRDLNPLTYRTLHLILHAAIFGFIEAGFITEEDADNIVGGNGRDYFQDHFKQDYKMIDELIGSNDTYMWIYQAILSFDKLQQHQGSIQDSKTLNALEKDFEEVVIDPTTISTTNTIQAYHRSYLTYLKYLEQEDIAVYIDEIKESDVRYPFIRYFSYLKIPTLEDLKDRFLLLKNSRTTLPLLGFVLERYKELADVSSLPAIIDFTNLLINKYNYQISRRNANEMTIQEALGDDKPFLDSFKKFKSSWKRLTLLKSRAHRQEDLPQAMEDYPLSWFLLSAVKGGTENLLIEVITALATLQNEFIYTAKMAASPSKGLEAIIHEQKNNISTIQTIKSNQVLHIDEEVIQSDAASAGFIHNHVYGQGREIYYDFEEIESKLHQNANRLRILDERKLMTMKYQFELYSENNFIITDVRRRNPQEKLIEDERLLYKHHLSRVSKKDLLAFLGSLDYVFTYLQNKNEGGCRTLGEFCQSEILNYQNLSEFVITKQPFSRILVKNIIDLYETLEEVIFEKVLRVSMPDDYLEKDEDSEVIQLFRRELIENKSDLIPSKIKEPMTLVKILKKIMVRTSYTQVNPEKDLLYYLTREDMWDEEIGFDEVHRLRLSGRIKLKHAYVILKSIESRLLSADHNSPGTRERNRSILGSPTDLPRKESVIWPKPKPPGPVKRNQRPM